MRRLACLGVILSAGLVAACSSDTNNGGTGGGGGGAAAGATGHGGSGGSAGHAGGAGGQPMGGAAGSSVGGNGGQPAGGNGGQSAGGAGGQPAGGGAGHAPGGAGGQPAGGSGGQPSGGAGGSSLGGAGGSGGQSAGGNGGQPSGGAGGSSLGGAGGSGSTACLDPSMYSTYFTIAYSTFCAVALYTAPEGLNSQAPTWGSHGGPLVVQPAASGAAGGSGTGVTLERWTAPTGSSGAMTVQTTAVASVVPAGAYLGFQALDLPFFGWTALSYTNTDFTGKIAMVASGAVATAYDAYGVYSVAAVPAASSVGRLLFTGLGAVGSTTSGTNGLYQADACASPSQGLGTGTGCSASALVAGWGQASGPVATDSAGDVFAVMSSYSGAAAGTQEARGFLASSVARGAAATTGVTLFTIGGYGSSLAALSPTATGPGVLVFQPNDSTTYSPLDVIEQKFTTGNSLAAMGGQPTLLTVANAQALSFLVDGSERLWVAASGTSSTTYVVLARK